MRAVIINREHLQKESNLTSMIKKAIAALLLLTTPALSQAQPAGGIPSADNDSLRIDLREYNIHLPYNFDKAIANLPAQRVQKEREVYDLSFDGDQTSYLSDLASVYRIHVLTLEAEANNDALSAEKYINESISELQAMLENQPEIQSDRRFMELYRSVMAEYQAFYGINDPLMRQEGDIFAIQDEMFSDLNDEFDENELAFPKTEKPKTDVPIFQNRQVNNHLAYLWIKRPEIMEAWLQRSEKYFPMMEEILADVGVPDELKYLAMIESGLNPVARSHAAAVGMWQFIAATGGMYGLDVNWWVDERRDPVKATRAAAEHLRDLYNIWGDWHLAMANYNISPRGLKRAIRRAGGVEDYWAAYPYLPRETRGYVPSFIATFIIATNPTQFGFQESYEGEAYSYETTEVTGSYQLKDLAALIDITADELKDYNPELRRWATPPGDEPYELKIPVGTKEKFEKNIDNLPKQAQKQLFVHTVKRGEWLGKIANAYGVTVRDLYLSNDGLSTRIHPGQKIVIPVPEGTEVKQAGTRSSSNRYTASRSGVSQPANTSKLYYTVKPGDTIGHIAEWYNTYAWKIRSWNNTNNMIRAGQRLVIYVPNSSKSRYEGINDLSFAEKQRLGRGGIARAEQSSVSSDGYEVYQVRRNDSLYEIARSFDVSISELRQLNGINGSRIYPGQTLKIRKK